MAISLDYFKTHPTDAHTRAFNVVRDYRKFDCVSD